MYIKINFLKDERFSRKKNRIYIIVNYKENLKFNVFKNYMIRYLILFINKEM